MFHGTFQKLVFGVLLLIIIGVYGISKLVHQMGKRQLYLLHGRFYYNDKQQPSLPSVVLKQSNEQQTILPSEDIDVRDEQRTNVSPVKVKLSYKQQPNLPLEDVDLHDKQDSSLLSKETKHGTKEKLSLLPQDVKQSDQEQSSLSRAVTHVTEIDQQLLKLAKNVDFIMPETVAIFNRYIKGLSSSQVNGLIDMITQTVDVSNLKSGKAKDQFLDCAGLVTLRDLKDSQLESPISLPPSHQHCKKMSFKNSGAVVALISYPGSGNSWVRQLLESATGIYTGAVYCDPAYVKAGMIGEYVMTNNVIAVKVHYDPYSVKKLLNNDKAIYVVRSPFGAILSENNRNIARTSKKYRPLGNFHTVEVDFNYGVYMKIAADINSTHIITIRNYHSLAT